ncbi:hypothetical protein KFK09_003752 [Dendrobium nobile]|uniref:Uncharacterized protein n=1 Tax=Dendrobium nobile TaxID=94219 RepID=A0A8T3C3F0_DENNO|nr:hypothetical protein KFK09_003752 [Dendrobium nobile]
MYNVIHGNSILPLFLRPITFLNFLVISLTTRDYKSCISTSARTSWEWQHRTRSSFLRVTSGLDLQKREKSHASGQRLRPSPGNVGIEINFHPCIRSREERRSFWSSASCVSSCKLSGE